MYTCHSFMETNSRPIENQQLLRKLDLYHTHVYVGGMDVAGGIIERQSSIENEPRTLNLTQIDNARKAALYVVNTRSIEEALNIFTQGLEPVELGGCVSENESCKWMTDHDHLTDAAPPIRDIVSAPF